MLLVYIVSLHEVIVMISCVEAAYLPKLKGKILLFMERTVTLARKGDALELSIAKLEGQ